MQKRSLKWGQWSKGLFASFERFTYYLLSKPIQAFILIFLGTFVPVVGVLGILIAALVTLRKSVIEGGVLTLAASLPYAIIFYFSDHYRSGVPVVMWTTVGVAILSNVLTWVFAILLRRQANWSQLLQAAALVGVLVISVIHMTYPNIADWWGTQLQAYTQSLPRPWQAHLAANTDAQIETINVTRQYATGAVIVAILFNALLQLLVARWWQVMFFQPRTLRHELQGIHLSRLAGGLFALSIVLSYLGNAVVLDIMPVMYVLFGVAGLSLIHYALNLMRSPTTWIWMWILYMAIIFSLPVSVVLIALLALFDSWFDLRKRMQKVM